MLRNSQKIMSSTTNQWPSQNQLQLDDQKSFMASSSSVTCNDNKAMEKPNQGDAAPHQLPLKCPRCDSSNTKFCYYNNYSLSQPRHFCKACKRYWTRGGTLRNVPVGGGCRKNKRVKRQIVSTTGDGLSTSVSAAAANPSVQSRIDLSPASNHINNPLLYSLGANQIELNFPFSTLGSSRVSSDHTSAFDLHHQMNGLGVGFSPGVIDSDRKNGFRQIQDVNSSFYSSAGNHPIFGSSNFPASTSTMASLLSSGFQHHKYGDGDPHLISYNGDPHVPGGRNGEIEKEVKMGGVDHNMLSSWINNPNPTAEISSSSDPAAMVWSSANVGAWFDPSNVGSSVPSLI